MLDWILIVLLAIDVVLNIVLIRGMERSARNDDAILIALAFYKEHQQEAEVKKCSSKKELSFM